MKDLPNEKLWVHDIQLRLHHLFKVGKYVLLHSVMGMTLSHN